MENISKMTETTNLFEEIEIKLPKEPYCLVKQIPGSYRPGWDERQKPAQKTASCFVFDSMLPIINPDDRLVSKNIIFAKHDDMPRVVNGSGFRDDKGAIWFFLPTNILPNKVDAYWFRKIDFAELIEYANLIKSNRKKLAEKIKEVQLVEDAILKKMVA